MSQKSYAILELMNFTQEFEVISRYILKYFMFQIVRLALIRTASTVSIICCLYGL